MQQRRADLPFHDLHSFKDYVGFVKLCAPDQFPQREGISDGDQWTLDLAYEGLQRGLELAANEGLEETIIFECRTLFEQAFKCYRADDLPGGFKTMEAAQSILRRLPSR